jgi:hypothetical protein
MRSSKKRSRSSQNRPRTLGNIINRVFDSSGPEGKVRGTPQQIIEKYQMLARDAQLSNDRVAAENFLQHAEHYTRMLAEAMREMAVEQEARQQQYQQSGGQGQYGGQGGSQNGGQNAGQNGGQGGGQNGGQGGGQNGGNQGQPRADRDNRDNRDRGDRGDRPERGERQDRGDRRPEFTRDAGHSEQPGTVDVIDLDTGDDSGLIETPESGSGSPAVVRHEAPAKAPAKEAGAEGAEPVARRARGPRKPRGEGKPADAPPKEAAE